MQTNHTRNTFRFYILIAAMLAFLFFTNDFGLTDVQKTAIVVAAGIDREEDEFILTTQISLPQASKQEKTTETVQLVSRGKTVAAAFEQINAKTGWYPKLVYCNLLLLGEKTTEQDVFDALDFFLLDEYLSNACLVATCDGLAKDLLNTTALVDPSSSAAISKVLSSHAERVGSVLPTTLREFAIGYFSASKSSFLPIVKREEQQEKIGLEQGTSEGKIGSKEEEISDKPVFSAQETALFVGGKRVGRLTAEETFAFGAVKNKLKLASYSVSDGKNVCTLSIKQNSPKLDLSVGKDGKADFKISLTLTAGFIDYSAALPLEEVTDGGDVPSGVFAYAKRKLEGELLSLFEKTKACGCDLFELQDRLVKYENRRLSPYKKQLLANTHATVMVRFINLR